MCQKDIRLHLIIMAICHIVNFLFSLYLFCKFKRPYDSAHPEAGRQTSTGSAFYDKPRETNICQRMTVVLCYDCAALFFMLVIGFSIVWAIIGSSWLGNMGPYCKSFNESIVYWDHVLIYIFWAFLAIGIAILMCTICIQSCDEGSCTGQACCGGCIYCCTCGLCGRTLMTSSNSKRLQQVSTPSLTQNPTQNQLGWTSIAKKYFGFGCGPQPAPGAAGQTYAPNNYGGMNQPAQPVPYNQGYNQGYPQQYNNGYQMNNQPGGYNSNTNNPAYNYPAAPPEQPPKKKGFLSNITSFFKK